MIPAIPWNNGPTETSKSIITRANPGITLIDAETTTARIPKMILTILGSLPRFLSVTHSNFLSKKLP